MEAKELRIGNLIKYHDRLTVVDLIYLEYLIKGDKNFQSIQLTEDVFIKLGAVKDEDDLLYIGNGNFRFYLIKGYIQVCSGYTPLFNAEHIKSVHSFQNLHYDLTNEELIFKE